MPEQCPQQCRHVDHKGTPPTVEKPTRGSKGLTPCSDTEAIIHTSETIGRLAPGQAQAIRRSPDKAGRNKGRRASQPAELSLSDVAFSMDFEDETLQLEGWTVTLDAASAGRCDWR
jgi:hypothetical protein